MKQQSKGVYLENVSKIYQSYNGSDDFFAVDNVSLTVNPGEFVTLLGPSGCGKSTTLRMVAGFEFANKGNIKIGDTVVNNLAPNLRNTAMVFQSYALFPHLNIFDNVAYGLKIRKLSSSDIKQKVMDILKLVGLEGMESRATSQISGGQQQRVALARALVMEPDLLLFDEPLSNLDAKLRVYMRTEIKKIQQKIGITAIYVTHDQSEAMSLSDKIIIMNKGKIEQMGTPEEIYNYPKTKFVAEFIGNANFIDAPIVEKNDNKVVFDLPLGKLNANYDGAKSAGDKCSIVIRPEAVQIVSDDQNGLINGVVTRSTFMGNVQEYEVKTDLAEFFIEDPNPRVKKVFAEGDKVKINLDGNNIHIID